MLLHKHTQTPMKGYTHWFHGARLRSLKLHLSETVHYSRSNPSHKHTSASWHNKTTTTLPYYPLHTPCQPPVCQCAMPSGSSPHPYPIHMYTHNSPLSAVSECKPNRRLSLGSLHPPNALNKCFHIHNHTHNSQTWPRRHSHNLWCY